MIKFTFTYLKPVALFLSIVVLFQCCVVYDKQPVTIDQAINKDHEKAKRIKIEFVNGKKLILDSIYYKGNELYYAKKFRYSTDFENPEFNYTGKFYAEIKIEENEIVRIRLQNIKKSRVNTALLILVPIIIGTLWLLYCINKCFMTPDCQCF